MEFKPEQLSGEQIYAGRQLFGIPAAFVLGVARLDQLPLTDMPEVAFAGRSNVGKSSLINALTGQKGLAKTSNTPGRTQQLNYFNIGDKLHLVDLPGYGYAQAPEKLVKQWQNLIFTYLQGRVNLKGSLSSLIRVTASKKSMKKLSGLLDKAAVTYQIILTKTDKISTKALEQVIRKTKEAIAKHPAAYVDLIATSSEKGIGLDNVRAEIAKLL